MSKKLFCRLWGFNRKDFGESEGVSTVSFPFEAADWLVSKDRKSGQRQKRETFQKL